MYNMWISVKDKLPKCDEYVLVYMPELMSHLQIQVGTIWHTYHCSANCLNHWLINGQGRCSFLVTHWMKMPETPKQEIT